MTPPWRGEGSAPPLKTRVVVAMSGGVDSAVAAALLAREGCDVVGVTLRLADLSADGLGVSRCCSQEDVEMARAVCLRLGIAHDVLEMGAAFRRAVIEPFVDSYLAGETPLPCANCNASVKFGELLEAAFRMGAETLATGHYARVAREGDSFVLRRGLDREKDQSYFLFALEPWQLEHVRFPLGGLTKGEVRALAAELGLPNASKEESQEVCFVPAGASYVRVLETLAGGRLPGEGEVVDGDGRVLGRHGGYHRFTVGQRRGLGVADGRRLYVLEVRPESNQIVVGTNEQASRRTLLLREVNWLAPRAAGAVEAAVQVRSRHEPARATVRLGGDGTAEVKFAEPVHSPAPGQAAVCYDGDRLLGGGWIAQTR
jgi:tRNA-specific 2-thiouridylase